MKKAMLILAVILTAGCATTDGDNYMPSEAQEEWKNPYLQRCGTNSSPICHVEGGRARQRFSACTCTR